MINVSKSLADLLGTNHMSAVKEYMVALYGMEAKEK